MTADQKLRLWDIKDAQPPVFTFDCAHPKEDSLSAIAVTKCNNFLVTGDTSGQMKMWDITDVDFRNIKTKNKFIEIYFIIAHKAVINQV